MRGFGHQMKMIVHRTPRVNLPVGFLASLGQDVQEQQPVFIVVKDRSGGFTQKPFRTANPNAVAPALECGRVHIVGENFLEFSARQIKLIPG